MGLVTRITKWLQRQPAGDRILCTLLRLEEARTRQASTLLIGDLSGVRSGRLYTLLRRFEREGLVASSVGPREVQRGNRSRYFYRLTYRGRSVALEAQKKEQWRIERRADKSGRWWKRTARAA